MSNCLKMLEKGDENNFNFINKEENQLENIENKIKEKFGKIEVGIIIPDIDIFPELF